MLVEFSVVPLGKGESVSEYVAECMKIVRESGVRYLLTPMATILEGEMDEVMEVVMKCHTKVLGMSDRVITTIKIDDRKGRKDAMTQKIKSVEDKLA
ncbi:MAG: MTH1187 family thiamine-binding protein [Methanomassiliicoccales archaeon]|nr:MTH1187 family thiamine-binding protein [Methanomassiliicoccales archaeon]NYT14473.1 MTH1187 family thiamine-binding protein [Methanomassiliicoccales archaeon]